MKKGFIVLLAILMAALQPAKAQRHAMNMPDHDEKAYYFGITLGGNFSQYRAVYTPSFTETDTLKRITAIWKPGFNLGLMGNLRLGRFADLRFIPTLIFAEKGINYVYGNDSVAKRSIESIYMHLPLQIKFKSDRIQNFRFYGMLGGKFDFDLAANARSRRPDEWLKVSPIDYGAEIGVGFEFYYPNFIFSPEVKISQGFKDQLFKDPNIQLSNSLQSLKTRMIVISVHLEG